MQLVHKVKVALFFKRHESPLMWKMGIARGQVPNLRGRWASRTRERAPPAAASQVDLVMRSFNVAPGARRRVDLVTSVRKLYNFIWSLLRFRSKVGCPIMFKKFLFFTTIVEVETFITYLLHSSPILNVVY